MRYFFKKRNYPRNERMWVDRSSSVFKGTNDADKYVPRGFFLVIFKAPTFF